MSRTTNSNLVYSSEHGRMCGECGKPIAACQCKERKATESRPDTDGIVRVRREKSGRGGKTVTAVYGVPGDAKELKAIAKKLKKRAGCGGSVKDWTILIQGDRVQDVMGWLQKDGFTVKKSGG